MGRPAAAPPGLGLAQDDAARDGDGDAGGALLWCSRDGAGGGVGRDVDMDMDTGRRHRLPWMRAGVPAAAGAAGASASAGAGAGAGATGACVCKSARGPRRDKRRVGVPVRGRDGRVREAGAARAGGGGSSSSSSRRWWRWRHRHRHRRAMQRAERRHRAVLAPRRHDRHTPRGQACACAWPGGDARERVRAGVIDRNRTIVRLEVEVHVKGEVAIGRRRMREGAWARRGGCVRPGRRALAR